MPFVHLLIRLAIIVVGPIIAMSSGVFKPGPLTPHAQKKEKKKTHVKK